MRVTVEVDVGLPYHPKSPTREVLGDAFEAALVFAARAHRDQRRKGPDAIPYVSHLMAAASLVLEHGGDEAAAIAALLHDCLEDCGIENSESIAAQFGDEVLSIVRACSDAEVEQGQAKPEFRGRKERYLAHLASPDVNGKVLLVSACDKLHNARSILRDLRAQGRKVWERFSRGEEDQLWYYRSLARAFLDRVPDVPADLAEELDRTVKEIERLCSQAVTGRTL